MELLAACAEAVVVEWSILPVPMGPGAQIIGF